MFHLNFGEVMINDIKLNKDKTKRLRRQMVKLLQDEDVETEEKYEKIIELWEAEKKPSIEGFYNSLGIDESTFNRAKNYIGDKRENPKSVEGFSAGGLF